MEKRTYFISLACLLACLLLVYAFGAGSAFKQAFAAQEGARFGNDPEKYPVRGVDVSKHQGDIDWEVLAGQDLDFAYIKATEGADKKDKNFAYNWEQAAKTHLETGAYHLFTFEDPAQAQADNFIGSVPAARGLPPAVDVELYGKNRDDPPEREKSVRLLGELLGILEKRYGRKPAIYATKTAYKLYISGNFEGHPLWVRDPDAPPVLPDGRAWTIWQYNNDGELKGYTGANRFIDLNVFNGTKEEFEAFTKNGKKQTDATRAQAANPVPRLCPNNS